MTRLRIIFLIKIASFPLSSYANNQCVPIEKMTEQTKCLMNLEQVEYLRAYFNCRMGENPKEDGACKNQANDMNAILPLLPLLTPTHREFVLKNGPKTYPHSILVEDVNKFFIENEKALVEKIGSDLHDKWRSTRLLKSLEEANTYLKTLDPNSEDHGALKKLIDNYDPNRPIYKPRHKWGMDIANTSFPDLNFKGQRENLAAAQHMVAEMKGNYGQIASGLANELNEKKIFENTHNAWVQRNSDLFKNLDLSKPENFDKFYKRLQSGEQFEGYHYKMEDGKRVEIPESNRYPPLSQLKTFSELSDLDQDLDRFVFNSAKEAIQDQAIKKGGFKDSERARRISRFYKTDLEKTSKTNSPTRTMGKSFVVLFGAISAIDAGVGVYQIRQDQKMDCQKAYPFIPVRTFYNRAVSGDPSSACRALLYDVEKASPSELKSDYKAIDNFLNFKNGEILQVLNPQKGSITGSHSACFYYSRLYNQLSGCKPNSRSRQDNQKVD